MKRRVIKLFFVLPAAATLLYAAGPDPIDLLRRSVQAEEDNLARAASYLYTEDVTHSTVEGDLVLHTESQRYEVIFLGGKPYFRLKSRDGLPLPPDEEAAEKARMDAVANDRRASLFGSSSPAERPRISVVYRILLDSHEVRLIGEDTLQGRAVWILEAIPKRKDGPGGLNEKETRALRVKVWIDQDTLLRVRLDAEAVRSAGRLDRGAQLSYRFARQTDGVWLVQQIIYRVPEGRSKAGQRYHETDQSYSNYHKFQVESSLQSPSQ